MAGERKIFDSKRKQGSISFDVDTDDGILSYHVMKMTCAQVTEWHDYTVANTHKEIIDGKEEVVKNSSKNWMEKLLSLSVVDAQYQPLSIEHFNEWTVKTVNDVFTMVNDFNFPQAEVEKKES